MRLDVQIGDAIHNYFNKYLWFDARHMRYWFTPSEWYTREFFFSQNVFEIKRFTENEQICLTILNDRSNKKGAI